MSQAAFSPAPLAARRSGLALPFAVIGFAGSAIVADLIFGSLYPGELAPLPDWIRASVAVVFSVTVACALLGVLARRVLVKSLLLSAFLLAVSATVAGAFAGAMSGGIAALLEAVFAKSPSYGSSWFLIPAGGYLGFLFSPAFWLPLGANYFTWRKTGEARGGSVLAESERGRVWVATACTVALVGIAAAGLSTAPHAARDALLGGGATAALGLLAIAEVARLRRVQSLVRGLERIAEPRVVSPDTQVDLGIGDELWVSPVASESPYRGVGRSARSVRGALFDAQGRLTRSALVEAWLFGGCLVLLVLVVARSHPPELPAAPLPVVAQPAPKPASTLPAAGVRWLSWYPLSPPILVDIDGDTREDIVGLRWNGGNEAHALSVTATNGATLAPMWQSPPIACQWANPHIRLLRSGDRLFLTDSEQLMRVYDLRTGHEIGEPLKLPDNATMQCADEEADADSRVWLWEYPKPSGGSGGYVLDSTGLNTTSTEPKWCVRHVSHPACASTANVARGTCQAYADYHAPPLAPKFNERYALEENGDGVAIGFRRGAGDVWSPEAETLIGFDPKTKKVRWDQLVAKEGEAHAFPRIQVDLQGGRVFTFFQVKTGAWQLSTRDVHTGTTLWSTEPPRAMEGTNFDSMTLTSQGVYLGLSNRLEVFDPVTGQSRGVVW